MASVPLSVLVEGPAMASVLVKKAAISACEEGRLESWLHSSARRMLARLSLSRKFHGAQLLSRSGLEV